MNHHRNFATILLLAATSFAVAQEPAPKPVPATSIAGEAKEARESIELTGLTEEVVVSGRQLYDAYFLGAERLIFESGAELVFSERALKTRNNLIVAARTIVMKDQSKPGRISWSRGGGPDGAAPTSGQAPRGADGNSDGASGVAGQPGATGLTGPTGRAAPNLTLFVASLKGAPPIVDMRGQQGGEGGPGQRGGDGGSGAQGSPASASLVECKRGAGHGGNGGIGGQGGTGGKGGTGGAGGTLTLVSMPHDFPTLLQLVRAEIGGGEGGAPGDPSLGGAGGRGGSQGAKALPYCKDEPDRRGKDAGSGAGGVVGSKGDTGLQGDIFFTSLEEKNFTRLFGLAKD
jgi:hypothetical protein